VRAALLIGEVQHCFADDPSLARRDPVIMRSRCGCTHRRPLSGAAARKLAVRISWERCARQRMVIPSAEPDLVRHCPSRDATGGLQ